MKIRWFIVMICCFTILTGCSKEEIPEIEEEVIRVPSKAELVFPENNTTCFIADASTDSLSTFEMSWKQAANTHAYDLRIENMIDQSEVVYNDITDNAYSITLKRGLPYSWSVTSKSNDTTETATSETWSFYLAAEGNTNYAPFPPTLLSPGMGVLVSSSTGKATLSWQTEDPDGDEITYSLYIGTSETLESPPEEYQNLTVTELEVPIEPETVYYWKVKATDGENSSFSQTGAFRTD
ncbi:hypothetical protein E7Z59_08755 [Robertkochia marina]|uniref:Fibronectin type-III domain-containing protein n=1 Tax=Robertkochia marina TaxID=1227945 RepID=A0A4S3M034_9FLAO|nr:hypothetical protein [Robertkochia marina]THD67734.1 hypothetical protein E7Z59_08755 [Robertkochia marina]TRZ40949.1 hypothetical protein D3A96_14440 [Robertkochia marina]